MKKMKRILSLVLCTALVCALMFVATPTASASTLADALVATINNHGTYATLAAVASGNAYDGYIVTVTNSIAEEDPGTGYTGDETLALNIPSGVTVNWEADFKYIPDDDTNAIEIDGAGTFNVVGGTISATGFGCTAIYNAGTGDVIVDGEATVSAAGEESTAINNIDTGTVYVTGAATVSATGDYSTAIYNYVGGEVYVKGGLVTGTGRVIVNNYRGKVSVSDGVVQATGGIAIYNNGTTEVSGGVVEAIDAGTAISNDSSLSIEGGLVRATTGYAICKVGLALPATLSGTATVFAYGTEVGDVIDGIDPAYTIADDAIILAWDAETGTGTNAAGTDTDITIIAVGGVGNATAVWENLEMGSAIGYTYGFNIGRISVDVTLGDPPVDTTPPRRPIYNTPQPAPTPEPEPEPEPTSAPEQEPDARENTFSDVSEDDWFFDDVAWAAERGFMTGTSESDFAPNGEMTRAMVFTVLARIAGVETTDGETWYSLALAWGVETGLTDGSNPDGNVTREQLVTLLWRYAGSPSVETALDGFNDADSLSDWASDAMAWAVSVGIIRGNDDGSINPQGDATRAEVAAMLRRFVEAA